MFKSCNGVTASCKSSNSLEGSQTRACIAYSKKENTAVETTFNGFSRKPVVLLSRIDIRNYLNGSQNGDRTKKGRLSLKSVNLKYFTQVCKVNLLRDDLNKLKKTLNYNIMNSPSSSISTNKGKAYLKCKICEKAYSCNRRLQNHQKNKHMIVYQSQTPKTPKRVSFSDNVIVHELKEYHRCRKCTKIFENYKSLKTHMKQQHRKRKCYICHYCSKDFVDRMFFKVHIKLHCDVCGELLPNRTKYNDHRRIVCKVLKLHKCKTCDETFFKFMDLKDHSYDHLGTFFICDICKDQLPSKCAVAHHISYLHSKKRPTALYDMRNLGNERLYLCNFCDESSVERVVIENHLQILPDLTNRAMTGYKDFYFCNQCPKKFDSEKDMLQHKWTHFLSVSDHSQVRPKSILSKTKISKRVIKYGEEVPKFMLPKVILEKIKIEDSTITKETPSNEEENSNITKETSSNKEENSNITKETPSNKEENQMAVEIPVPVVNTKPKKTTTKKHQCKTCNKYLSRKANLQKHIEWAHSDYVNLLCKVCEKKFEWPSQMQSHKCIRLNNPPVPQNINTIDVLKNCAGSRGLKGIDESTGQIVGPVVDVKSKKTLLSKHQCQTCGKYYSSNYCLMRHLEAMHSDYENLQCKMCEEKFAWPSLLQSHKCIRLNLPEMPFDDARPEIHFDNLHQINSNGFDDFNIDENDDYMHSVDFEIPTPIVELTEYEHAYVNASSDGQAHQQNIVQKNVVAPLQSLGYKVVMQEVPIEF